MNIFYSAGTAIGNFRRGIQDVFSTSGSHPSVDDPSAWVSSAGWGEGILQGKKPRNKKQFIQAFQHWVYICVKLNAQSVASVPLRLYVAKPEKGQKFKTITTRAVDKDRLKYIHSQAYLDHYLTKAEEVEEVTEHAFLDLMQNVNPFHNQRDLKEYTTMFADLTGEAYWYLVKVNNIPVQIYPIPSQYIDPIYGKTLDKAIDGYVYKRGNVEVELKEDEVVMFPYPNPNNIFQGFSVVRGIADTVYIGQEMNAFETALFENRARPGVFLESTENIGEQERKRMQEVFEQKFKGTKKAGKTVLLPKGVKANRDAMTPEELSFIEGGKANARTTMAALDIPEAIFFHANRAESEAAKYFHAEQGIKPRCSRFAEKINEKILPLYGNERNKIFCVFDDPVPENRELVLQENTQYVAAGIKVINEVRADIGLEDVEGADELLINSQYKPLSQILEPPQPPPDFTPAEEEEVVEEMAQRAKAKLKEMLA